KGGAPDFQARGGVRRLECAPAGPRPAFSWPAPQLSVSRPHRQMKIAASGALAAWLRTGWAAPRAVPQRCAGLEDPAGGGPRACSFEAGGGGKPAAVRKTRDGPRCALCSPEALDRAVSSRIGRGNLTRAPPAYEAAFEFGALLLLPNPVLRRLRLAAGERTKFSRKRSWVHKKKSRLRSVVFGRPVLADCDREQEHASRDFARATLLEKATSAARRDKLLREYFGYRDTQPEVKGSAKVLRRRRRAWWSARRWIGAQAERLRSGARGARRWLAEAGAAARETPPLTAFVRFWGSARWAFKVEQPLWQIQVAHVAGPDSKGSFGYKLIDALGKALEFHPRGCVTFKQVLREFKVRVLSGAPEALELIRLAVEEKIRAGLLRRRPPLLARWERPGDVPAAPLPEPWRAAPEPAPAPWPFSALPPLGRRHVVACLQMRAGSYSLTFSGGAYFFSSGLQKHRARCRTGQRSTWLAKTEKLFVLEDFADCSSTRSRLRRVLEEALQSVPILMRCGADVARGPI
ncbi:unnamed protein product, partial [Effrenium voratum]